MDGELFDIAVRGGVEEVFHQLILGRSMYSILGGGSAAQLTYRIVVIDVLLRYMHTHL